MEERQRQSSGDSWDRGTLRGNGSSRKHTAERKEAQEARATDAGVGSGGRRAWHVDPAW